MEHNEPFSFTYCAQQQQEVEQIRQAYLPKEESKLEQLRALHASATRKAKSVSIALGIIGSLVLGTGMSLCMTDLGAALGTAAMPVGIAIGLLGLIMVALAYPVFNHVLKKQRQRIAPEILRLSEELLQ